MNFYLAGQTNFGNRGCEALVRGTANMLSSQLPGAKILCPLKDIVRDSQQWSSAESFGVNFVSCPIFPENLRWWARANRILPLERWGFPLFQTDEDTVSNLNDASALIMTGGDNLTLDYGVLSLYQWGRIVENAMDMGVPAVLWAASVGPFSKNPRVEKVMAQHLKRYAAITVRETVTLNYLRSIGVDQVELVADPAFLLTPEPFDFSDIDLDDTRTVLGFNVSPLIRKFRKNEASAKEMDREIASFLRHVIEHTDMSVILIPHVDPLDGTAHNSDWHYMKSLYKELTDLDDRIAILPPTLNASQLKHIIGKCSYFIGARTHSTIAALSQGVPTISIAYSSKAIGINRDLYGSTRYVLETPSVTKRSLTEALSLLQSENTEIRAILADKLPEWRERAKLSATALRRVARIFPDK